MRRALACAAAVVVVLLGTAPPARAAEPVVEFATPTDEQRFTSANVALDATVRMPNGGTIRGDATVTWFSAENRPVPAATSHPTGNNSTSFRVQVPQRTFPWNGRYRVEVAATGRDGMLDQTDETGRGSADFVIDAAPAPPPAPTTAVNGERKVAVSWPANNEPDMFGYEVQRQLGSAPWEQVTVTGRSTTSVVDSATTEAGGTYRYRVVALRSSADAGQLNPSLPSNPSTAKVPAPPVTTTTTAASSAPAEEETSGGGNRSGTSTGSGSTGGRPGGGSTGSGGGTTSGPTPTTLPTSGKVDLSGFASLLEQARQSGRSPALAGEGEEGSFEEALPFAGRPRRDSADGDAGGGGDVAIVEDLSDDDGGRLQSLAFLAGGLLTTVLVMHLLWVRSEVRRADVLEAVAPTPPPARPPRRRRFAPAVETEESAEEREPVAVA
ncbi:MAG TPA: fibronectin type III domain-containing protein [Acidimicrobiales bacterium]|nr:fibronectin type III domain-containing protein [Acidimicrobiales bacterium]